METRLPGPAPGSLQTASGQGRLGHAKPGMGLQRDATMHFPSQAPTHFKGCQPVFHAKVNTCSESISRSHPSPKF